MEATQEQQTTEQLKCKICNNKRPITKEEINKYIEYRDIWNIDTDDENMFSHFNIVDKKTCPGNKLHDYEWNMDFYEEMLKLTRKRKNGELDLTRNNNEISELEKRIESIEKNDSNEIEKLKEETEQKIKELTENKNKKIEELKNKIEKNKQDSEKIEKENPELEQTILNQTGQSWKKWL